MSLKDEITSDVDRIFRSQWTKRKGVTVPAPEDIGLEGNDGVEFDGVTVLYADLSGSTHMVDQKKPIFAAEVYKAYLLAAAKVIRSEGGEVTAYDGDRVMAVFVGDSKNSTAARCALKINYVVKNIVTPTLRKHWDGSTFEVKHVVGIDTSPVLVARTGVRGDNDLVWVGRSANYAAKLTALNTGYPTYITGEVFDRLRDDVKYGGSPSSLMWEERSWTDMNKMRIFRSNWWWAV